MSVRSLFARVEERIRDWNVVVEDTLETRTSFVVFGRRGNQPVVLKVLREQGDEWRCGEILEAFDGNGIVRVFDYIEGAVLIERLNPATPLASLALAGRDDDATVILAEVIQRMSRPLEASKDVATVQDWGSGFRRYLAGGDRQIEERLVQRAQHLYSELCASQGVTRLLHGDLQHYNVLFDQDRGWIAIDPKGVVGETEYEIGASLRNPYATPELLASREAVERRLSIYAAKLKVDYVRALAWGFSQAVLSAIWSVEDGFAVNSGNPAIMLANAILPLLE